MRRTSLATDFDTVFDCQQDRVLDFFTYTSSAILHSHTEIYERSTMLCVEGLINHHFNLNKAQE